MAATGAFAIAAVLRSSLRSMRRDADLYDGRSIPWTTKLAAALAAALYAPWLAGGLMALPVALAVTGDGTFFLFGLMLLGLVAGLIGLAVSFIFIGMAVGSVVLVDRPGAWWYARVYALVGLFFGWLTYRYYGDNLEAAKVVGAAIIVVATLLLALVLPPRGATRPAPVRRRQRFFL